MAASVSKRSVSTSRSRFGFGRRRDRSDDSIIRGAAIIRDKIAQLDVSVDGGAQQPLVRSSRRPPPPVPQPSGPRKCYEHEEEDDSHFSDPWATTKLSSPGGPKTRPRSVTPDTKLDDSSSFAFESSLGGSSGSQVVEWANRALNAEDASVSISISSVRTPQPDTDPCEPLQPPRSRSVGHTRVASYDLVAPLAPHKETCDNYDFVERDYEDMEDYEEVCGRPSYLPKTMMKKNSLRNGAERDKRKVSDLKHKQPRLLQLVTSPDKSWASPQKQLSQSKPIIDVVSPISVEYTMLLQDPAYLHAQRCGHLWQSLVGGQIRFPSSWWNGARAPPMGDGENRPWQYFGRYPSQNPNLRRYVKHRSAPGRLLLHIIVQDLVTWRPVQDIVVGCFDPNSRGIRKTREAEPDMETMRELWLAVRKRSDSVSVIDSLLAHGRSWKENECKGPLGPTQRITNSNVRAVFGEEPPVETVFVHESTLYERLVAGRDQGPPLFLVREFVFC